MSLGKGRDILIAWEGGDGCSIEALDSVFLREKKVILCTRKVGEKLYVQMQP